MKKVRVFVELWCNQSILNMTDEHYNEFMNLDNNDDKLDFLDKHYGYCAKNEIEDCTECSIDEIEE